MDGFTCSSCNQAFAEKKVFLKHVRVNHEKREKY